MGEQTIDAKEESASSAAPVATASQDDKKAESSTVERSEKQTETLASVVEQAARESLARERGESEESDESARAAEKVSSTEEQESTEGEKATDGEKATEEGKETKEDEEVPQEFHEHPAWKRIISERNEARERITKLEAAANANVKLVEFCERRGIDDKQFQEGLEFMALINTDPVQAYEKLRPVYESLEAAMGKRLPEDLKKKVDEGVLDPETAEEVARLRAQQKFGEARGQQDAARQQRESLNAMVQGLNDWDANKRKTDPDFDKKAELVRGAFLSLYQKTDANGRPVHLIRTPQEAVALAEQAYKMVDDGIQRFVPKKGAKTVVTSRNAVPNNNKHAPRNLREAVAAELKEKHGIEL